VLEATAAAAAVAAAAAAAAVAAAAAADGEVDGNRECWRRFRAMAWVSD